MLAVLLFCFAGCTSAIWFVALFATRSIVRVFLATVLGAVADVGMSILPCFLVCCLSVLVIGSVLLWLCGLESGL